LFPAARVRASNLPVLKAKISPFLGLFQKVLLGCLGGGDPIMPDETAQIQLITGSRTRISHTLCFPCRAASLRHIALPG
jgi:hypothetical protein